jgi:hypothetical protein
MRDHDAVATTSDPTRTSTMLFRTGLFVGSLAAAAVLAAALSLAGLGPGHGQADAAATASVPATPALEPAVALVQVDTVYLLSQEPKTIVVRKAAPTAASGEEGEGEDDDD